MLVEGDALLNGALRLVAERLDAPAEVRLAVTSELARGVAGMIDGQSLNAMTADGLPDEQELIRIHRLKTGAPDRGVGGVRRAGRGCRARAVPAPTAPSWVLSVPG